ncbi:hypothetical protein Cri9333_2192 [Crinalium epipsammum PCC 9333]|uniref:Uncharacterized protein n=1 Tax=Crinalium epipsammum PCC 9333 TaxID=1173022 RepID=K9VY31_9CYAN|nr:hypothetical protein [Crinalium epipsammum]AFZ12459.1 hypothetical protein Cri9333_1569 [Crinalium epipsammum PCC 9333]AFZ13064.1 hypothetical protein Cri9333_2192 [Crinalium epipsammum PCC 9333]
MQAPSARLRHDSLTAHTDQTRFLEGEAGNRAQSDICYEMTLALTGSSYGETEPKKATQEEAGHNIKNPDFIGDNPAAYFVNSGKSLGVPMVELATPNGTNNLTEGTNKNDLRVKGMSNPK